MHRSTKQLKVGNLEAGVGKKNRDREKGEGIISARLRVHAEKRAQGMRPHPC